MAEDNYLLALYAKTQKLPAGKWLFSRMFANKAPYFKTIRPTVEVLRANYCELSFKKRKAVQNHIGTVHAIALCNGLEMAMGALAEASIPKGWRWIPKQMDVRYTAKANSDIKVVASLAPELWQLGDVPVKVQAFRADGEVVIDGTIYIYVSERPPRH